MGIIDRIKSLLGSKTEEEIRDFRELLKKKFGFEEFLYATTEGLPIMGTFPDYEEFSAKVPEILKSISELKSSNFYSIVAGEYVYTLVQISSEVLMLARGFEILGEEDIQELVDKSRKELGI
ncbi:hypothetical protein [Thermococcus sp.]